MKITKAENFARSTGNLYSNATVLKCLLVIFISVLGSCSCQAQTNDVDNNNGNVSVQAVVFIVIAATMCLIFWACYACICFSKQNNYCAISTTPQLSPVRYSTRNTHQSNGYSQNSARARDYSVPRRFLGHTEDVSGQSEFNDLRAAARVGTLSHSPISVSLPEATLHQGDAPPTYEEAIGMKTVNFNN